MIKKFFIFIGCIWVAFLFFLIFQGTLDQPEETNDTTVSSPPPQKISKPSILTTKITDSIKKEEKDPDPEPNKIPLTPIVKSAPPETSPVLPGTTAPQALTKEKSTDPAVVPIQKKRTAQPFGLICTKFERMPSRFRLLSWEGSKRVLLEDLEAPAFSGQKRPQYWFELRRPYKEFKTANSGRSVFRVTKMSDPNKRLIVLSLATEQIILPYSSKKKTVAHAVMRDYKLSNTPYELSSDNPNVLSSGYRINFQQTNGVQEYFHDLTGKPLGYKFGGSGFEYQISKLNFPKKIVEVTRKDLKTRQVIRKEIVAQNFTEPNF